MAGVEIISASRISQDLGVQHTQVRKDLAMTGAQGTPKVGHKIDELIHLIEEFLSWNQTNNAFLVGVGNLGMALLGYEGLMQSGLRIVAAFDHDPSKIGTRIGGIKVVGLDRLSDIVTAFPPHLAIITTPADVAQGIADRLIESGVKAIWNFAPIRLHVPSDVVIENVDMRSSLAVLSYKLKQKTKSCVDID